MLLTINELRINNMLSILFFSCLWLVGGLVVNCYYCSGGGVLNCIEGKLL